LISEMRQFLATNYKKETIFKIFQHCDDYKQFEVLLNLTDKLGVTSFELKSQIQLKINECVRFFF
jgi:hypothetical protein